MASSQSKPRRTYRSIKLDEGTYLSLQELKALYTMQYKRPISANSLVQYLVKKGILELKNTKSPIRTSSVLDEFFG
ncbi:MAG: hypothetical protein ACP5IK_03645, partial [Candidatus Micrarchaeia archaeon]